MIWFELATADESLGVQRIALSNVEKYGLDLCWVLDQGVILTGVTAAVTSDDAVVNGEGLTNDRKSAVWFIEAPDTDAEFDLNLTVTTSDGQTFHFTLHYQAENAQ